LRPPTLSQPIHAVDDLRAALWWRAGSRSASAYVILIR
jgi:hypothetical protein